MDIVWFLLIGAAAGWLAGLVMKGGGFGIVGNLIVGVIGAILGGFLFNQLGLSSGGGLIGALVTALVGAVLLLVIVGFVKKS